ncbi:MAG: NifB/NifX family molybdenum-iron cluster-binding protein [Ruminiclostridium sp.]
MTKIAVASTDGVLINEHFGSAKEFLIYEVSDGGDYKFLERIETSVKAPDSSDHGSAQHAAELLKDVDVVLVSQIGPNATRILEVNGIKAYSLNSNIDKALQTYGKRSKLIHNLAVNPVKCNPSLGGCSSGGCSGGGCR